MGVEGHLVEVEADLAAGLPGMSIVGLADTAVGEARDRARAAVHNSGLDWPARRITVGLSPAWLHKRGSMFDLAIAIAVLTADERLPAAAVAGLVVVGELGLDGGIRPVRGVLVAAMAARDAGAGRMVVPAANAAEAVLVPGLEVIPARSLRELVARLRGEADHDAAVLDADRDADWTPIWTPTATPTATRRPVTPAPRPPGAAACRRRPDRPIPDRIWPTSGVIRWPGRRWRSPRRAGTTWPSWARPASARRCSPGAFRGCCRTCPATRRWRSRRSTRWPAGSPPEG